MPERKTRSVGRPKMAKGRAKARIVPVRFTPELFNAVTKSAKASKQSVSEWIRYMLTRVIYLQDSGKHNDNPIFQEEI
jgi:hypothetical protein